jgi:murein DD-endopeptidase MepM/ murein hydrolase activator NlpD
MPLEPAARAVAVALLLVVAGCSSGTPSSPTPTTSTPPAPSPTPPPPNPTPTTFTVSGTVRDAGNGNQIESARVDIGTPAPGRSVQTPFEGTFSASGLSGSVTFSVSRTGYATATRTVTVNANTVLDFELTRVVGRSLECGAGPDTGNRVFALLSRPFNGQFRLGNFFDHDSPFQFQDTNGYQLNACGDRIFGRIDGHSGYDWLLPSGTPLLATTDGTVVFAGLDPPFSCPPLGRTVADQQVVSIRSDGPMVVDSQYLHLSRIDVATGQRVTRGQTIGLSGNTGCSTAPHLHFQVRAVVGGASAALVDPYGWEGTSRDPWSLHLFGRASIWLWRTGEAPTLRTQ